VLDRVDHPSTAPADPRSWRAETIDASRSWYFRLPDSSIASLRRIAIQHSTAGQPVTAVRLPEEERAAFRPAIQPILEALEAGRGFAIIDRIPMDSCSFTEAQTIYWLVGQLLGEPFEQNVQGTLLYDVRDTGRSLSEGARFSVTNYESSFHTDNSFGQDVLDYVGLLCLNSAKSGGLSQVVSGYAAYEELIENHPDDLDTLCQAFHVDRRGGTREGESATIQFPVIQKSQDELLIRYLRYWIEVGHEKAKLPLTPKQVKALDTLDEVLRRPELRVEFFLEPGQMFFINNRWILHNRTAFEDHEELERKRHYVRLWLKARF
jgi:alpha-ketoglutarate-dependent taurine dioxygenase